MILDSQALFSDAQAITSTAVSTNYFDKGAAKVLFGRGEPISILCQVVETFTAAGAATLTVTVEMDDNTAFSSPTVLVAAAPLGAVAIPKATLVAGYQIPLQFVLHGLEDTERYIQLRYTVTTGPMTAGKITAGLVFGNNVQSRSWN